MTAFQFAIPTGPNANPPVLGYTPTREQVAALVEYESIQTLTEEEALEEGSYFGLPIFGTVELKGFDYENGEGGVDDLLIESVFVEVNLPKNIVKTQITGRDGTVKEMMGLDDHQIKLTGSLFSPKGDLRKPWNQIQQLNAFARHLKAIQINNNLLYRLGVYDMVIDNVRFISSEFVNVQRFELTASSDREFELKINETA